MSMTKKDYLIIERILEMHIRHVMERPIEERAEWSKVDLQDLVHEFVCALERQDPKFKRQDFIWKSGALDWLQN